MIKLMIKTVCLLYTGIALTSLCSGCGFRHESRRVPVTPVAEYYDDYYGSEVDLDNPYRL